MATPQAPSSPPPRITRSCPQAPGCERLPLRCLLAGHWRVPAMELRARCIDESVLIFCTAGEGWMHLAGRRHPVRAGQIFLCPPLVTHGYGCDPARGWEIRWVHMAGSHAVDLCGAAGLSSRRPVGTPGHAGEVAERFEALLAGLESQTVDACFEASARLYRLLVALIRRVGAPDDDDLTRLADWRCESLDDLVRRSGYSKYHFCRRFKDETGHTPWQYVLARKMERARELLLEDRLTVKEVAARLGFPTPDYFARLFARHTGVTPSRYRGRQAGP